MENGKIKEKGIYKGDKKDGEWVYYFDNGQLIKKEIYVNEIIKDGEWIEHK